MKQQQPGSGKPDDNPRVSAWGVAAVIAVLLGALAYFHALQKRFEIPAEMMPPAQSAPSEMPGVLPGR
jgi:hypothetical protein